MFGVYMQVGGCCLIGAVYWYNFYPTVSVRDESAVSSKMFSSAAIQGSAPAEDDPENPEARSLQGNPQLRALPVSLGAPYCLFRGPLLSP